MPTALDIITTALKDLGVIGAAQVPTAEDAADGLSRLNSMIDSWGIQRLTMFYQARVTKALSSGVASYTVGVGGDINIARPQYIESVGLIIDNTVNPAVEVPMRIMNPQEWASIRIKTLQSSLARAIYYDYGWNVGLAMLYVHPVPNTGSTTLVLYCPEAVSRFADLSTAYTMPPGYQLAFESNLTVLLAPSYRRRLDPDGVIATVARESLADVKIANMRPTTLECDPVMREIAPGTWNWMTGGFR